MYKNSLVRVLNMLQYKDDADTVKYYSKPWKL